MANPKSKKKPARGRLAALMILIFIAGIGGSFIWLGVKAGSSASIGSRHSLSAAHNVYADYAGSESCRECHAAEYKDWKNSHHGLAEREPAPALDDAAFIPERTFHHGTQQTTVLATNGHYELITLGLHGTNETYVVKRILAHYPLRQMLIPFPGGRVQVTEAAWDPRSNQWFDVYGNEDRKPGEWGQWLGRGMNWNSMCAICHNTRVHKNYDATTDTYHTTFVEHGVGCESCHGPMKAHNDWQRANKDKSLKDPTIHKFTRDQIVDNCAACHSRRAEITGDPKPGDSYWDDHLLSIVDDTDLFYPDGQIHDEDYEYTAFIGSRMYNKGVRCMDCHNVHTMKPKLPGNFLCLSCHAPGMTNGAPPIDPVKHSHHKVFGYNANGILVNANLNDYKPNQIKETGGECINCHMPQTVYMQRHWRHDHGFTIPDPLLTKEFGIPNACNRCHTDKNAEWSLAAVNKWYGTNINQLGRQRATAVTLARNGDSAARDPLLVMLVTNDIPYWNAVAAGLLQQWSDDPAVTSALLAQLKNTNALVRQMVVQSLGVLAEAGRQDIAADLQPMLQDKSRNVRIEAARHLQASLDTNSLAGQDYLRFLKHIVDQPLGQLQNGMFDFTRGDLTNALGHFQKAAEWDTYSAGIHHELAILLSQLGRVHEAVTELERAVRLAPKNAEFHYKLALALNEAGEKNRVIPELELAVKYNPHYARAWYNLGLARSAQGDDMEAEEALARAETADPNDPRIPYARATVLARLGKLNEARISAQRALELNPHFTKAIGLLRSLTDISK